MMNWARDRPAREGQSGSREGKVPRLGWQDGCVEARRVETSTSGGDGWCGLQMDDVETRYQQ